MARLHRREAHALQTLERRDRGDQFGQARIAVAPRPEVDPAEHDFAAAARQAGASGGESVLQRHAARLPAHEPHDAVGADAGAAVLDLQHEPRACARRGARRLVRDRCARVERCSRARRGRSCTGGVIHDATGDARRNDDTLPAGDAAARIASPQLRAHRRPVRPRGHRHAGAVELLRAERRGAAGDDHAPAGRGRAPRQPPRLALGLGGHAAGVHDDDVGVSPRRHRLQAGGGEARRGPPPRRPGSPCSRRSRRRPWSRRLVRCSVSHVPSSAAGRLREGRERGDGLVRLLDEQAGQAAACARAAQVRRGGVRRRRPATAALARGAGWAAARCWRRPPVGAGQRIRGIGGVTHEERRRQPVQRRVAGRGVDGDGVDVDAAHRREAEPQGGEATPRPSPSRGRAASPASASGSAPGTGACSECPPVPNARPASTTTSSRSSRAGYQGGRT